MWYLVLVVWVAVVLVVWAEVLLVVWAEVFGRRCLGGGMGVVSPHFVEGCEKGITDAESLVIKSV